jgi:hypothetical protein
MRTTLDLDEDLVNLAKQVAQQRGTTMGRVISDLVRKGLQPGKAAKMRNGVPLFEPRKGVRAPDLALVNQLRDDK